MPLHLRSDKPIVRVRTWACRTGNLVSVAGCVLLQLCTTSAHGVASSAAEELTAILSESVGNVGVVPRPHTQIDASGASRDGKHRSPASAIPSPTRTTANNDASASAAPIALKKNPADFDDAVADEAVGHRGERRRSPGVVVEPAQKPAIKPFINVSYLPLDNVQQVSRFRSAIGHDFSDPEEHCRSMKHYHVPRTDVPMPFVRDRRCVAPCA